MIGKQIIGQPGPFQIIDSGQEAPITPPRRRYSCENYECCLDMAAALNWDSFTCRGCCGDINQSLLWRAHQAKKRDAVAESICDIPNLTALGSEDEEVKIASAGGKR